MYRVVVQVIAYFSVNDTAIQLKHFSASWLQPHILRCVNFHFIKCFWWIVSVIVCRAENNIVKSVLLEAFEPVLLAFNKFSILFQNCFIWGLENS